MAGGWANRTRVLVTTLALLGIGCGSNFSSDQGPPTDGLVLWLAADRGVTQSGGVVTEWLDQSGHHSDALQTASNARPTLDTGAFGDMHAVVFDGVDDFMKMPDGFADFTHGLSFFSVVQIDKDDPCVAALEMSNGAEIDDVNFGRYNGLPAFEIYDQFSGGDGAPFPANAAELYTIIQHPDSNVEMRLNGALVGSPTIALAANITRTENFVGRTLYADCTTFGGHIGEIMLYNRAVNDRELLDIESYLGKRAGCCQ